MNPLGELGPTGPIPRSRTFRIAAVFVSGMYEYDSKFAYIALRDAQRFFRMGDAVTGLELRFANVDDARPLMRRIIGVLEGFPYRGKDWGEMNRNLFSALRLERVVMFILLSFQVLIACICVIATLVMLVVEKRKEVATLKAMGAREGSIMKLFVIEGLIIGAIGTFYGSAAGLLFCKLIEKFGVGLDPEVYYITRLPVVIEPLAFVSVALVAMLLVFVATIYPARRGGSIAPVEGFREE
jgi:lipoprotein-releasing system permease protein